MIRQKNVFAAMVIPCLLLSSCGGTSTTEELHVSGAKSGVAIIHMVAKRAARQHRPSGTMGIFTGLYLAQGIFLPVQGSEMGFMSIAQLLKGQTTSTSNENFALLREIGDILTVNIPDMLNRSPDRSKALDEYNRSLRNSGILLERKVAELEALHDTQEDEVRETRSRLRELERSLNSALRDSDYATASEYEEQVAEMNVEYADISTKEDQTQDMIKRFEDLYEIATERIHVVEKNREIILAGLRVIDLPGINDLNILEEGKSWNSRRSGSIFGNPR